MAKNEKYPALKFQQPQLRYRKREQEVDVWVPTRGWLVLTPEEWVRRHVVAHLVERMGVPITSIVEEYPVLLNGQNQRADIVVVGPDAKPWLLVECKAPEVAIDRDVVAQAVRYNSVVGASQILLTNGVVVVAYTTSDGLQYSPCAFPL